MKDLTHIYKGAEVSLKAPSLGPGAAPSEHSKSPSGAPRVMRSLPMPAYWLAARGLDTSPEKRLATLEPHSGPA